MTVRCFWCGATNDQHADTCTTCKRKLQWSNFFKAVLRPTVGCLMGDGPADIEEQYITTKTPAAVA